MKKPLEIIKLLIFLLFISNTLFAQREISGKILDSETGIGISDIVIKLKDLEISTVSDSGGYYKIYVPDDIENINFSDFIDYKIKEIKFISENKINLILEDKIFDLLELTFEELLQLEVSSAGKTDEKVSEVPASIVIITRQDIENYGYRNISELLQHVSGLYLVDDYSSHFGTLGMRGFLSDYDNRNYAILVNNIYQYNSKFIMPIQAIDRIEIIRGPMSVIYGSGSMCGAINIITNIDKENIASVSYGNNNTIEVFSKLTGEKENFKYNFIAAFNKTDGINEKYIDIMGDKSFEEFQYIQNNFYGHFTSKNQSSEKHFEKKITYLNFNLSFNNFKLSASHINRYHESFSLYPSFNDGIKNSNTNTSFTLNYNKELFNSFSINAKTSYYHINNNIDYDFAMDLFYGNEHYSFDGFESEIDMTFKPSKKLTLLVGSKYSNNFNYLLIRDIVSSYDPSITNLSISSLDNLRYGIISGFSQVSYSPFEKLRLIAGVRLEQTLAYETEFFRNGGSIDPNIPSFKEILKTKESDLIFIPRIAIIYSLHSKHIFKLLYGESTQIQNNHIIMQVNDYFEPKRQKTIEFDYLFTYDNYSIGLNFFRNDFQNLLNAELKFDAKDQSYLMVATNSGKINTIGSEFRFIMQASENLRIEFETTYQKTENPDKKEITVAYSPDLLGQVKILYKINKFSFALTGYYVDEMESLWEEENYETGEPAHRLGDKIDSYFAVGINLRANNIYKNLFANLRVSNILDETIRYPTTQINSSLQKGTFGEKRFIYGTIGWKF